MAAEVCTMSAHQKRHILGGGHDTGMLDCVRLSAERRTERVGRPEIERELIRTAYVPISDHWSVVNLPVFLRCGLELSLFMAERQVSPQQNDSGHTLSRSKPSRHVHCSEHQSGILKTVHCNKASMLFLSC